MKRYALPLLVSLVLCSCSTPNASESKVEARSGADTAASKSPDYFNNCKQLFAEARRMDSILLKEVDLNTEKANAAIKAFTDFAYYCKADSLSPVFLIKTAQVAKAIENIPQAKLVLDRCIEDYPNFQNRAAALFLLAQLYDEHTYLNNEAEAKRLYQKIIDEYPKSDWALSSQGAIHFIGKSDEEITRELLKRKK